MKKIVALLLILIMCMGLAACGSTAAPAPAPAAPQTPAETPAEAPAAQSVTLNVVTSYGGDDGNRKNFEAAVAAYEAATGNKVNDGSATSNEEWKAKVLTDFETGSEPDVLFFFTNADAEPIISAGKVVSIDEIRAVYPDYASNMKDAMMAVASDGKQYAVPSSGFWENMFVNKSVLVACGKRFVVGIQNHFDARGIFIAAHQRRAADEDDRQIRLRLADKILSESEKHRYDAASDKGDALLRLWVLKEASVKLTGRGLRGYPNHTDFDPNDPRVTEIDGCYVAVLEEDYAF